MCCCWINYNIINQTNVAVVCLIFYSFKLLCKQWYFILLFRKGHISSHKTRPLDFKLPTLNHIVSYLLNMLFMDVLLYLLWFCVVHLSDGFQFISEWKYVWNGLVVYCFQLNLRCMLPTVFLKYYEMWHITNLTNSSMIIFTWLHYCVCLIQQVTSSLENKKAYC